MRKLFFSPLKWFVAVVTLTIFAFAVSAHLKLRSITELEDASNNPSSLYYSLIGEETALGRSIGNKYLHFLHWGAGDSSELVPRYRTLLMNASGKFFQYFRLAFYGRFVALQIQPASGYHVDDLQTSLSKFSDVEVLSICERQAGTITDSEWLNICTQIRQFPNLTIVTLGGSKLSDEALSKLKDHPNITSLSLSLSQLTTESVGTIKAFPSFKKLSIYFSGAFTDLEPHSVATVQAFDSQLPPGTFSLHPGFCCGG